MSNIDKLNGIGFVYDLHPENYKTKRQLTRVILDVFETKFNSDPEYKKKYEALYMDGVETNFKF